MKIATRRPNRFPRPRFEVAKIGISLRYGLLQSILLVLVWRLRSAELASFAPTFGGVGAAESDHEGRGFAIPTRCGPRDYAALCRARSNFVVSRLSQPELRTTILIRRCPERCD